MDTDTKKGPRARLKTVETDPIFEAKKGLKFEASFGFNYWQILKPELASKIC